MQGTAQQATKPLPPAAAFHTVLQQILSLCRYQWRARCDCSRRRSIVTPFQLFRTVAALSALKAHTARFAALMVSKEEEWLWEAELSLPRLSANRGHEVLQLMQAKQGLPAVLQARGFLWTLRTAAQGRLPVDDSVTGTLTALGILAEDARDEFATAGLDFTQLIPDSQLIRNVRFLWL